MSNSEKPILIVGGGPVGLMCALYLRRVRGRPVVVLEQQPHVGGLYASVKTPWGIVDQGVHIPQLTGLPELDDLFFEVLPPVQWQVFSGVRKDIAGNLFSGKLNMGSLYPDIRELSRENYLACLGDILDRASRTLPGFADVPTLRAYFEARFGPLTTDLVLEPISQKIWGQPTYQMSPWAAKLVHLSRLVTHPPDIAGSLKCSEVLDSVIGFPDQLSLSSSVFVGARPSLYPTKFGLSHVVEGWLRNLQEHGVTVMTASAARALSIVEGRVQSVGVVRGSDGHMEKIDVSSVVWTSPLAPLERLLDLPAQRMTDAPVPHRMVHLFLDRAPQTGPLYWLWSFDINDVLVRVSSPHAYCPDAASEGSYQICAELHVPSAATTDDEASALAEQQLRMRGLLVEGTRVIGYNVLSGIRTFPVPTASNVQSMLEQRRAIEAVCPENLLLATQDLSTGIFYMPDILLQAATRLSAV